MLDKEKPQMSDTTNQNQPSVMGYVKMLFSPGTIAALRYALTALAPVMAMFGFAGLTPDKVNAWVAYAQQFGVALLAVLALIGIVVPVVLAILGVLSSRIKVAISRLRELANNPALASAEAAKALTEATAQLAKSGDVQKSADAVNALVKATIELPQVQTIVTDAATSDASPSPSVVSADVHDVVLK
jgi:hypothetical protein